MREWDTCQKILCIRADNMGDVLMSTPAFKALKESLNCEITLLTSSRGAEIGHLIPEIDRLISIDLPWVQTSCTQGSNEVFAGIEKIKLFNFDGCIIFSVYSQNSLPAALMAYLANIPLRLAYCRENPYNLLTHWLPDKEPYSHIIHQVERDLKLVASIGATTSDKKLSLTAKPGCANEKLISVFGYFPREYFVFHPGVSEEKRKYPVDYWIELGKLVSKTFQIPILLTGNEEDDKLVQNIASEIGDGAYSLAGLLTIEELACLIRDARALVSVNTGTIHISAAMQTPVLVLYAQTNPQHFPWMVLHRCLEYSIPSELKSHNEVIAYVNDRYYNQSRETPSSKVVLRSLIELLKETKEISSLKMESE